MSTTETTSPMTQVVILFFARFAEPIVLTSVNPYLPEMIKSFGVPENDVAKCAGKMMLVFSILQSIMAVPWGRASDIFGRKPTIIAGLITTMVCSLALGISKSLTMAFIFRALQGANGNVGIIRTMIAEMVPAKLQPKAFSLVPQAWSLGSMVGPAMGGFFAKPADRFPGIFGGVWFFETYPFALPNLVACVFILILVATVTVFLKETPRSEQVSDMDDEANEQASDVDDEASEQVSNVDDEATALLPSKKKDRSSIKQLGLLAYTFLALHTAAYDQVLAVFLDYPVIKHTPENTQLPFKFSGGFGMEPKKIGTLLTICGILCGLIQFIIFPPLMSRIGAPACVKMCCALLTVVYIFTPYIVLIEDTYTRLGVLVFFLVCKSFCVIIGFPSLTILLNKSCSAPSRGTLNGLVTAFSALGRGFGAAITGACFSWGVKTGYMSAAWWFLTLMALIGTMPTLWITDDD